MIKNKKILVAEDLPEFQESLDRCPPETSLYIELLMNVSLNVDNLIQKRGITQKDFADKLNKTEPEISKWLAGGQNFTLRTLAKISVALGEPVEYFLKDPNDNL